MEVLSENLHHPFILIIIIIYIYSSPWQWTRSTSGNTVVRISTNPVLIIDSASVSESGDYTCIGTNNRGNDRDTITVTVNGEIDTHAKFAFFTQYV